MTETAAPLWPVWVRTDQVGNKGFQLEATADQENRERIAEFCGVEAVEELLLAGMVTR